jgi:hypothetical protein
MPKLSNKCLRANAQKQANMPSAKMLRATNAQIKQQMRKSNKCSQTCKNAYGQQMPKLSNKCLQTGKNA